MKTRSGALLQRLMEGGEISAPDVCRELSLGEEEFAQILAGTRTMSLAHQLCFATLLIERVPRLARGGKTLRDQALAAIACRDGDTTVHSSPPVKWTRLQR